MFQWATDQFDKLTEAVAPPPTDAAGRFAYACSRGDENTCMGCIAEIDPVRTVVQQSKGLFPIHMACQYSMLRLIRLLMNQPGVSIQQPDYAGQTPLHHACMTKNRASGLEVVKILLQEYSADPCAKNSQGQTPYDVATLDSIRQYLLPIQLQRETQYALDNGGVGLAPGIDLGGLKINRSNMAPPPQFGGAGVAAPPAGGVGTYSMASTPDQSRYPQTPGMPPAPAFGSPMATASTAAMPPAPQQHQIPAAQPIARAPASMPARKSVSTGSSRAQSSGSSGSRHARSGGSSLAVYSKYKADGFHSSSSDVGLQQKYGHHGAKNSSTTPPPSSGNAPSGGNVSSGPNPFSGAANLGGVSRYAAYGPVAAPAPSSGPIYSGMGFSHPAPAQTAPKYFTPGATAGQAPAPAAPSNIGPSSPFMPPPPYSGTTASEPVTPAPTPAPAALTSPFVAPQSSTAAPAAASDLFESPPKAAEPATETTAEKEEPAPSTTTTEPDSSNDASSDWVETTDPTSGQTYFFNTKTNETSWEKPSEAIAAPSTEAEPNAHGKSDWVETLDPSSGNNYYYNEKTGETSWEKPSDMTTSEPTTTTEDEPSQETAEWEETTDPSSGNKYYYNTVTGETSWERPAALDAQEESTPTETSTPEATTESVADASSGDAADDDDDAVPEEEKPVEQRLPEDETATVKPVPEETESTEVAEEKVVEESTPEATMEDETPEESAPVEERTSTEPESTTEKAEESAPGALQEGWIEATDPSSGKVYYYNMDTQETSWERPVAPVDDSVDEGDVTPATEPEVTEEVGNDLTDGWEEVQDPTSGNVYYYNKETQETSWEKPITRQATTGAAAPTQEDNDWAETLDPSSGKSYYYNAKTGETSWEKPTASKAPEETPASQTQQPVDGAAEMFSQVAIDTPVKAEETDETKPQSSPLAASHERTLSAQEMFASPPSDGAPPLTNFGKTDVTSSAAGTQGPVGQTAGLSSATRAEDLFGAAPEVATPLKVPDTAEDLFGAAPEVAPPAEVPVATQDSEPIEDDEGMTDIPLSPDPTRNAATTTKPIIPNITGAAPTPAPAAQNDLFASIGMPPPPFQSRR